MNRKPVAHATQLNKLNRIWNAHYQERIKKLMYANGKLLTNISIGGTGALILSQLLLGTEIEDLDIFISKPTKEQIDILNILKGFSEVNNYPKDTESGRFNIKLPSVGSSEKLYLNIMTVDIEVPRVLHYERNKHFIPVGGIEDTMLAKMAYRNLGAPREKDVLAVQDILNFNFNWLSTKVLSEMEKWLGKEDASKVELL